MTNKQSPLASDAACVVVLQEIGASGGLRALEDWVHEWDAAFEVPSLALLLPFARCGALYAV